MPYVIKYNGTRPTKLSSWPKYNEYKVDVKYQEIAKDLGLKANTPEEGVNSLIKAVIKLSKDCNVEASFKELGLDKQEFMDAIPSIAEKAFEDQCTPANPRLAMI